MALAGRNRRWLEVNDALSRTTGCSRDELKATTLRAMAHPDDDALDTQRERDLLSRHISSYQVEKH
jgi:PAS domain S-box-containing protein